MLEALTIDAEEREKVPQSHNTLTPTSMLRRPPTPHQLLRTTHRPPLRPFHVIPPYLSLKELAAAFETAEAARQELTDKLKSLTAMADQHRAVQGQMAQLR